MGLLDDLTPAERRAIALIGLMIRLHGGKDGEGRFAGVARYGTLEARLRLAAERSRTVRQCWDLSAKLMGWGMTITRHDDAVLALIAPQNDDPAVLRALADSTQSCIMIARHLDRQRRGEAREGAPQAPMDMPELADPFDIFDRTEAPEGADAVAAQEDQGSLL